MSKRICGMDEVGRGALAGPLVACGVVLKMDGKKLVRQAPVEIRDSKKMTLKQREKLVDWAKNQCTGIYYQVVQISVSDINRWGIGWANRKVFALIIEGLGADEYVIDGKDLFLHRPSEARGDVDDGLNSVISTSLDQESKPIIQAIPKADSKVLEVMLAANIAKVYRDGLMKELHTQFPQFGWGHNAGYGTRQHLEALDGHGICVHHRVEFVENALLKLRSEQLKLSSNL